MDTARLRSILLFSGLMDRDLDRVAQLIDEVEVDAGTRLVHEGDYSYEVFVIDEGSADVIHEGHVLAQLGPGDFFGELGVMAHEMRTADVVAATPLKALVITDWSFRRLVRDLPPVAEKIRVAVAQRALEYVSR